MAGLLLTMVSGVNVAPSAGCSGERRDDFSSIETTASIRQSLRSDTRYIEEFLRRRSQIRLVLTANQ